MNFFQLVIIASYAFSLVIGKSSSSDFPCLQNIGDEFDNVDFTRIKSAFETNGSQSVCDQKGGGWFSSCIKSHTEFITLKVWRNGSFLETFEAPKDFPKNGSEGSQGDYFFNNTFSKIYDNSTNNNTVMIFHGFRKDMSKQQGWMWVNEMATIASQYPEYYTVIFVDWSRDSFKDQAVEYLAALSQAIGSEESTPIWLTQFSSELIRHVGRAECWGHSLGSILCATIGKNLKSQGSPGFVRHLGMDTAGQNTDPQHRSKNVMNVLANFAMSRYAKIDETKSYLHNTTEMDGDVVIIHSSKHSLVQTGINVKLGAIRAHGHVDIYLNWLSGEDEYCSSVNSSCKFHSKTGCIHSNSIYFWIMLLKGNIAASSGYKTNLLTTTQSTDEIPEHKHHHYHGNYSTEKIRNVHIEFINHTISASQGSRILYTEVKRGVPRSYALYPFKKEIKVPKNVTFIKKNSNETLGNIICYPGICFGNNLYTGEYKFKMNMSDDNSTRVRFNTPLVFTPVTTFQNYSVYIKLNNHWTYNGTQVTTTPQPTPRSSTITTTIIPITLTTLPETESTTIQTTTPTTTSTTQKTTTESSTETTTTIPTTKKSTTIQTTTESPSTTPMTTQASTQTSTLSNTTENTSEQVALTLNLYLTIAIVIVIGLVCGSLLAIVTILAINKKLRQLKVDSVVEANIFSSKGLLSRFEV
ncbi:hypothetical protein [Carp edema virus]|nr:hypothetical protein [Carp edema virus]